MKRIFEFLGIVGILFCILAAFSIAEIAYGDTLDDILNYQYSFAMTKDGKEYTCIADFNPSLNVLGYYSDNYLSVQCTEKERKGLSYNSFGDIYLWHLNKDVVDINGATFAVGQSGTLYPVCGDPILRRD